MREAGPCCVADDPNSRGHVLPTPTPPPRLARAIVRRAGTWLWFGSARSRPLGGDDAGSQRSSAPVLPVGAHNHESCAHSWTNAPLQPCGVPIALDYARRVPHRAAARCRAGSSSDSALYHLAGAGWTCPGVTRRQNDPTFLSDRGCSRCNLTLRRRRLAAARRSDTVARSMARPIAPLDRQSPRAGRAASSAPCAVRRRRAAMIF